MKKIILALGLFALVFSTSAKQQKNTLNRSVYSNFSSYPTNAAAGKATRNAVSKAFAGWSAYTDKLNGTITTAYGPGIVLPGNTAADKATYCIEHKLSGLGINKSEWKQVSNTKGGNNTYLYYDQISKGHKVFMSRLSFQFSGDGKLLKIQMRNYGVADKGMTPSVKAADALVTAASDLAGVIIQNKQVASDWDWFPIPSAKGYALHPSWHFTINGKQGNMPVKLNGYVDGITGELVYRTNEIKDNLDLTVKGMVYKNGTLNPATLEALPDLTLSINGNSYTTDTSGYYSNAGLNTPANVTVPLAGLWSTVYDDPTGVTPSFVDVVNAPGTTYTYPVTAPSSSRHVNAYYHVNRVHNFMKKYFPNFTGMDFSLPTNVDVAGTCNAFYDGQAINFYAAGGGCNSFAELGDVIYHEYGHGISDHMYTDISGQSIQNGALNEASSDIWALSITRDPVLARNAFTGYQGFIRRYDMTPQIYSQDLTPQPFADPHENGQIIAGTWWDVGVNIGSVDSMTRLFTSVYYDVPDGMDGEEGMVYQTILIDALLADDNDNNPNNGTPHYSQIVAAFAKHGIYLEQDVVLTHQELSNMPAGITIPVTANLNMEYAVPFQNLLLYYRNHNGNTWDSIVMTSNNNADFTANIPAQDTGTILDYYFSIRDAFNVANAYFPIGYNPSIPSYESTIPYQFGIGIAATDSTTFEAAATGWHIANNAGDDATAGKWQQVVPEANDYYNAWPGADHTTGAGKCLLTGNGSGGFNATSITAGTSTVLSPVFDISTYHYPVIEYYRWFSNDLYENFKNDPWQVMIKDAGGNNWQLVEKTYQSDYNWRRRIFAVNEYLPAGTASIQVKFAASDSVLSNWEDNGQSLTVGGMDDFYLCDAKAYTNGVPNVTANKAKIYPNPTDQQLEISFADGNTPVTIALYDMSGKSVYNTKLNGQANYNIGTAQLAAGMYNLVIQGDKSVQAQKVVVRHN